jgi:hypothetical protein
MGQSVTVANVTFHVPANYGGTLLTNVASVTSSTPDPTPNNNSSSISTTVTPAVVTPVVPIPVDARWMLLLMMTLLVGAGLWQARTRRHS